MGEIFYFSASGGNSGPRIHRLNSGNDSQRTSTGNSIPDAENIEEHSPSRSKTYSLITGCQFVGNNLMARATQGQASFNDFKFYDRLCNMKGCTSVRISTIRVRHNNYCHGIQVGYKSKFHDGSTSVAWAEPHFYERGYYYYTGTSREETWVLGEEEYICGLRIQQGDIVDGITFVTNERQLHSGGYGGNPHNMMLPVKYDHRIIAFAGTEYGVLQRIGYYAKPFGWSIIRPFVMLRWLKIHKRAFIEEGEEDNVLNKFMDLAEDGIFRNILEYLVLYRY